MATDLLRGRGQTSPPRPPSSSPPRERAGRGRQPRPVGRTGLSHPQPPRPLLDQAVRQERRCLRHGRQPHADHRRGPPHTRPPRRERRLQDPPLPARRRGAGEDSPSRPGGASSAHRLRGPRRDRRDRPRLGDHEGRRRNRGRPGGRHGSSERRPLPPVAERRQAPRHHPRPRGGRRWLRTIRRPHGPRRPPGDRRLDSGLERANPGAVAPALRPRGAEADQHHPRDVRPPDCRGPRPPVLLRPRSPSSGPHPCPDHGGPRPRMAHGGGRPPRTLQPTDDRQCQVRHGLRLPEPAGHHRRPPAA
mmetsp:Transcript_31022/g.99986  ORF Transcript_31022/g.99986 Transcript_31022/m.99986 type:complete len:304 (-) Transcript_31022:2961-3872(-)